MVDPLISIVLLYATAVTIPLVAGVFISRSEKPVSEKLRLLRMITVAVFLAGIAVSIVWPEAFDINYLFKRATHPGMDLLLTIITSIVGILVLYLMAMLIPWFVFSRKWRGTTISLGRFISSGLLVMIRSMITWFLLYLGFELIQLFVLNPYLRPPMVLAMVTAVITLQYLSYRVIWSLIGKAVGEIPENLTKRINELSRRARIKVHKIVFLNSAATKVANAWAVGLLRATIGVTSYLVDSLAPGEVDAVIAHELGHLKGKHSRIRYAISIIAISVALYLLGAIKAVAVAVGPIGNFALRILAIILCVQLLPRIIYRKQELKADETAAHLTGKTADMISAIIALTRLNDSSSRHKTAEALLSTHPDTRRRVAHLESLGMIDHTQPGRGQSN